MKIYEEYENRQSVESLLVKELDRFDVMLQAFQYEQSEFKRQKFVKFEEFFIIAKKYVHHPQLKEMVVRIVDERERFFSLHSDKYPAAAVVVNGNAWFDIFSTNLSLWSLWARRRRWWWPLL